MEERSSPWAAGEQNSPSFNQVQVDPMTCFSSKGVGTCFIVLTCFCLGFFQSYGEGSHFNEHNGLSSPFLGTGISGEFYQFLVGLSQSRHCRNCLIRCLSVAQGSWAPLWPHQEHSLIHSTSMLWRLLKCILIIVKFGLYWKCWVRLVHSNFIFICRQEWKGSLLFLCGPGKLNQFLSNTWKCFSHLKCLNLPFCCSI